MSELVKRIAFAVPAAAFFLWVTWMGGWVFTGTIVALTLGIVWEMSALLRKTGYPVDIIFPLTIALWVVLSPYLSYPFEIGLAIFLIFLTLQLFKKPQRAIPELFTTLFSGLYPALGMLSLLLVRQSHNDIPGFVLTVALLFMVWGNDIFAYFGGKSFGRHPLAPKISPKKTWEGFFFGIGGAVVGLVLVVYFAEHHFPFSFWLMVPAAVLISIFGPVGDLTESRFKRAAEVKDSSNLLPGHGGLFDRFDALILAAPAMHLYLVLIENLI